MYKRYAYVMASSPDTVGTIKKKKKKKKNTVGTACQEPQEGEEGEPMEQDAAEIIEQPTQPSDKPRITTRYMTKYERARILGTRALQLRSLSHCLSTVNNVPTQHLRLYAWLNV